MPHQSYPTLRLTDREVIERFQHVMAALGMSGEGVTISARIEGLPDQQADLLTLESHAYFKSVLGREGSFFARLRITFSPQKHGAWVEVIRQAEGGDQVNFNYEEQFGPDRTVGLIAELHKQFPTLERFAVEKFLGKEGAHFYRHRESTLVRLEQLAEKLIN